MSRRSTQVRNGIIKITSSPVTVRVQVIIVRDVALEELTHAEECFLTHAVVGALGVARLLDVECPKLGTGRIAQRMNIAPEARFGFPRSLWPGLRASRGAVGRR
ncbi:MAG TPA: hypothetical protein VFG38_11265, partial [Pseudomonadales bacterium]|nr:hypothetical protein [Pseudomonadales bacterium]